MYAHSAPGRPREIWETHREHSARVAARAARLASAFGWAEAARAAGLLHDIGKCSEAFQRYIARAPDETEGSARGPDHSTAGAQEALRRYGKPLGRVLAAIIAGHHAGLSDGDALDDRLGKRIEPHDRWTHETDEPPEPARLAPTRRPRLSAHRGFFESFLTRMLFSCLVDADFLETEAYYASLDGRSVGRDGFTDIATLRDRLRAYMAGRSAGAPATPVNALRARVLDHATAKAELAPGFFTLTVPTGGGKTLASLSFALEHAARHDLRRVITVIPFTSIIEQTASVFREALGDGGAENATDVLEHHATFDWEAASRRAREDGRGADPVDRLRRAAENWAAPVVVTTAVQFFESLFSNRTSRCRKLHNLANSVIILDEAQTMPLRLLGPCLAALDELVRVYGASVVFCTATQPALRGEDGFKGGPSIPCDRELAPEPQALYAQLRRARVERLDGKIGDEVVAARFAERPQMLCVVNRRAHAQALYARIRDLPGAVHLSTLMCPAHRRRVLEEARGRLARGEPARIVSTSLIEAGVDIDLPEVWRAAAGLDSIAQAAGRCNREGKLTGLGRVVVFEPLEGKPPPDVEQAWQAARAALRKFEEPLGLDAVRAYFHELYWSKGPDAFDAAKLDGELFPILERIGERAGSLAFPFEKIARAFEMIDDVMEPIVVPWRAHADDREAENILSRVAAMDSPLGPDLRRLQAYTVAIPKAQRSQWLAAGALREVHRGLGDALLVLDDMGLYDPAVGVKLGEGFERQAESNVM